MSGTGEGVGRARIATGASAVVGIGRESFPWSQEQWASESASSKSGLESESEPDNFSLRRRVAVVGDREGYGKWGGSGSRVGDKMGKETWKE